MLIQHSQYHFPNEFMNNQKNPSTVASFIRNLPLFASLNRKEIDVVAGFVTQKALKTGEVLFHQWDKAEFMCFIEKGALEILKKTSPDEYEVEATLPRGRSVGEMSIIDNFPWPATARAGTDTHVVILTRDNFEDLMNAHQTIATNIIKGLARMMAQTLRKAPSRVTEHMRPLG